MDIKEAVNKLSQAGISFNVHLVDGWFELTPDEVVNYLGDPDTVAAKRHGVSVAHYRAWRDFESDPHCYALTKKNKPCKNIVRSGNDVHKFIPGVSEFCPVHQSIIR